MTHPTDMLELVPGPSQMLPNVLEALGAACGSSDLDPVFWDDYLALERNLQELLHAESYSVAIQSGEAMLALWGALKSTLKPGDVVVCAANGLFGEGFADMAKALGADVRVVKCDWRKTIDVQALNEEIRRSNPKLVTAVHCETPSGVLNNLEGVGETVANETTDGLFLVDFVSSAGGAPLNVDAWKIDLGLLGPHKALSGPPALAFTTVSEKAWQRINEVKYVGYDALQPFYRAALQEPRLLPYTHNWQAIRAALVACNNIKQEGGILAAIRRHAEVSAYARREVKETLRLKLYGEESAVSPTVTAIVLPEGCDWDILQNKLRAQKLLVGGSYGPLKGKVLRLGHMGSQANKKVVAKAIKIIGAALKEMK
ncbi:serine-pyruvate aminotransferase, putative [Phytophthora infestans T30-4]|uniref:alanine--glyoxylate transaminase n=1 Tax=Phytophthora infestans (strain T30-4) TaxID=403677 RepID=D0N4C3_PHYIT|nr:serine-pyruvate aminotransferase, putative [Phytophthora infestans T30-4]EEY69731.1 serine-pyruvate aminotransferase, putative [Phytophthora infestans T30-4]|eukprot:XP_002998378.1 serine-pyruvate aminotransferase, putative [Phytophthora infestans T30-4]